MKLKIFCALAIVWWLLSSDIVSFERPVTQSAPTINDKSEILEPLVQSWGDKAPLQGITNTTELDLGPEFFQTYSTNEGFNYGIVRANLSLEIEPLDSWLVVVKYQGSAIAVVDVENSGGSGGWYVHTVYPKTMALGLEQMRQGDRVIDEFPEGAFFILRGDSLIPINDSAQRIFPRGATLEEYQRHILELEQGGWWYLWPLVAPMIALAAIFVAAMMFVVGRLQKGRTAEESDQPYEWWTADQGHTVDQGATIAPRAKRDESRGPNLRPRRE